MGVLGIGDEDLLLVTASGKVIRFQTKQVRASGRATQGVRLIHLDENDSVCTVAVAREESE
jgi:DNA gyrase subunit A